ncbi:MAG TPA: ABC transporter ATP-binding protein [Actinomycetota bacterium]
MDTDRRPAPGASAGTPVPAPAIATRGLTKRFGDVEAVRDLTFEVLPRRVTGFLGPNGAGKSTTLRIVLGLVRPTDGTATVLGMPYASLPDPSRSVGAVLEAQSFVPSRTGRNHLRVVAAAAGIDDGRVDDVLDQVGLAAAAHRKAGTYSLGMRQRLALAGALLGDPDVLILDEPANGLDPQGIRWLRELLRSFAADGRAVLVSSHLLGEMSQLADEAIVIHRGRLVRHAPVAELSGDGPVVVTAAALEPLAAALQERGAEVAAGSAPNELVVRGLRASAVGDVAFDAGVPVHGLRTEHSSLEDAFLELTEGAER